VSADPRATGAAAQGAAGRPLVLLALALPAGCRLVPRGVVAGAWWRWSGGWRLVLIYLGFAVVCWADGLTK
jgi:hypothetical protein